MEQRGHAARVADLKPTGAQALLEALGAGAASDLIELDMRGNPLTVEHLTKLVRRLSMVRP